ncbi:MAG TPA: type II secretion system F family protein [Acidimicrobiales bacterium]|nr:type II secretion system F family protein [Acidimicrobiales bacterium]
MRLFVLSGMVLWVGATLLLSQLRWFARPPLVARLRPYTSGSSPGRVHSGPFSVESFRQVVGPLSFAVGERVARLFGVSEELAVRLERIHSPLDVTAFRVRQVGWSVVGIAVAALASFSLRLPGLLVVLALVGAPVLAFLILEQKVASASARWQRRLFLELPVLSEQLAMLLSAGFSLGAALNRLAARGQGVCSRDLQRVTRRMLQGLSELQALREWAAVARVDALDRLVPVLALDRGASDLGRLVSGEARAIRKDVQRELVETMERREQKVWIPVTVATLVPGVIFLCIPFIEALRMFSGS